MPTTLAAVAVAAMLVPGYVHRVARSRQTPLSPTSQLNELLALLTVSLVTIGAAAALHELARALWPEYVMNTTGFLRSPRAYWIDNLGLATRSIVGTLAVATMLAGLLGNATPLLDRLQDRKLRQGGGSPIGQPAWATGSRPPSSKPRRGTGHSTWTCQTAAGSRWDAR